ncbi:MAG: hypothetical protein HIU85_01670 [Proteobacteria bacterium]|nr:hypothetical protein [Pseudomonadota bacterium]
MKKFTGILLGGAGAVALGGIALHRHEPINALWIVTAALCLWVLGYRFYAAWVAARVLSGDDSRRGCSRSPSPGAADVPCRAGSGQVQAASGAAAENCGDPLSPVLSARGNGRIHGF